MYILLIILVLVIGLQNELFKTIITHIPKSIFYLFRDGYKYLKNKEWTIWNGFGLRIYTGLFGFGKTLSASRFVIEQAKKYNLNVYSNIWLDCPYTPLKNYEQIINAPANSIFLIDEISTLFHSRDWSKFPTDLLFQILQCRKRKKMLVATAQRFGHVDKLLRDITSEVVTCRKYWRYQTYRIYDAWEVENAQNTDLVKPLVKGGWFVCNKDYGHYDTSELIDNAKKADFISNSQILENRAPAQPELKNVKKPTRSAKKIFKK